MVGKKVSYSSLDTPAVLLDMDKLAANIRGMSQHIWSQKWLGRDGDSSNW